jgi:[ribosomal protein S5]-alanine N-acetyltransferase
MPPDVILVPTCGEMLEDVVDPEEFAARYGAQLGEHAALVRTVVGQNEAYSALVNAEPPWRGYLAADAATRSIVGTCAFKGAPDPEGAVEIAYFTFPPHEGLGYATAMARALVALAAERPEVRWVYAYTQPEPNASTRVLSKIGFKFVGAVDDPEDGAVWRWEYPPVGG